MEHEKKPNEAHVETCGAGYSEYAMCDSPEACADLRNAPVVEPKAACEGCPDPGLPCVGCPAVEPEPCRYTQPDGTRATSTSATCMKRRASGMRAMPEPECTGCPEPATKICTHCHDPKCDDCMPAFLCCACDEEADDA